MPGASPRWWSERPSATSRCRASASPGAHRAGASASRRREPGRGPGPGEEVGAAEVARLEGQGQPAATVGQVGRRPGHAGVDGGPDRQAGDPEGGGHGAGRLAAGHDQPAGTGGHGPVGQATEGLLDPAGRPRPGPAPTGPPPPGRAGRGGDQHRSRADRLAPRPPPGGSGRPAGAAGRPRPRGPGPRWRNAATWARVASEQLPDTSTAGPLVGAAAWRRRGRHRCQSPGEAAGQAGTAHAQRQAASTAARPSASRSTSSVASAITCTGAGAASSPRRARRRRRRPARRAGASSATRCRLWRPSTATRSGSVIGVSGWWRMRRLGQQLVAHEQVPGVDGARVGREGGRDDGQAGAQRLGQGFGHRTDVAPIGGVERGADLEVDALGAGVPQPDEGGQ